MGGDDLIFKQELVHSISFVVVVRIQLHLLIIVTIPSQEPFPLELICMMVDEEKITSDTGNAIRFQAHQQAAAEIFNKNILHTDQFYEVD